MQTATKPARPNRVRHSYTQSINGRREAVFPLLCPIREIDWADGWNPRLVLSACGLVEQDCVFVMPGAPEDTIWVVTAYEPGRFHLEMLMVTPGRTVGKLEITLRRGDADNTKADVIYTHTSLGPAGDAYLKDLTRNWYVDFMKTWEAELNHYLQTGKKRTA